jgi:hypothetical protein
MLKDKPRGMKPPGTHLRGAANPRGQGMPSLLCLGLFLRTSFRRPGRRSCGDPGPTFPCARQHGCRIAASGGVRHDGMEGAIEPPLHGLVSPVCVEARSWSLCMGSFHRISARRPGHRPGGDPGPTSPCARTHGCRIAACGGVRHDEKKSVAGPRSMGSFHRIAQKRLSASFAWARSFGKAHARLAGRFLSSVICPLPSVPCVWGCFPGAVFAPLAPWLAGRGRTTLPLEAAQGETS